MFELVGQYVDLRLIIDQRHVRLGLGESFGDRPADASGGSHDDGDVISKLKVHKRLTVRRMKGEDRTAEVRATRLVPLAWPLYSIYRPPLAPTTPARRRQKHLRQATLACD